MNPNTEFYLCGTCFHASEEPQHCHGKMTIHYAGASVEQRKPPMDGNGRISSRAPMWFLKAQARYHQ